MGLSTYRNHSFSVSSTFPSGFSGVQLWFQMAIQDLSVFYGATVSNGVTAVVP